jgi:hypothetical protein
LRLAGRDPEPAPSNPVLSTPSLQISNHISVSDFGALYSSSPPPPSYMQSGGVMQDDRRVYATSGFNVFSPLLKMEAEASCETCGDETSVAWRLPLACTHLLVSYAPSVPSSSYFANLMSCKGQGTEHSADTASILTAQGRPLSRYHETGNVWRL